MEAIRGIDGDLIVGRVAEFDAQIVIFQIHIEVGVDQLVLDELPDDAGHLVPVHSTTVPVTLIFFIGYCLAP